MKIELYLRGILQDFSDNPHINDENNNQCDNTWYEPWKNQPWYQTPPPGPHIVPSLNKKNKIINRINMLSTGVRTDIGFKIFGENLDTLETYAIKAEGLLKHARIAKNHIGVGISKEEIINRGLPLPQEDIFPEILEEKIISYADLFYSKSRGRLWQKKTFAEVKKEIAKFGEKHLIVLEEWHQMFGD